jgi:hypothetical protein
MRYSGGAITTRSSKLALRKRKMDGSTVEEEADVVVKRKRRGRAYPVEEEADVGFSMGVGGSSGPATPPAPVLQAQAISSAHVRCFPRLAILFFRLTLVEPPKAKRIVVQSMARNSAVTEKGMTSRKTGKVVSTAAIHKKDVK